jgi:alpha-L-rhamnosidase
MNANDACDFGAADLKTEYLNTPLGLETPTPHFSWRIEALRRGARQCAYRITVASNEARLAAGEADLWDSGRIETDRCFDVPYAGRPLHSCERAFWCVRVWDETGKASLPSAPSWFEMGLLDPKAWCGDWLIAEDDEAEANRAAGLHWIWGNYGLDAAPVKFRYTFDVRDVVGAVLLLSAKDNLLGVWVNGESIELPKAVAWGTMLQFPLTLKSGRNVVCIEALALTEGFLPPDGGALAALIRITHGDGTVSRLTSGPDWRATNEAASGWTAPLFDDHAWPHAVATKANAQCEPWPAGSATLLRRSFSVQKPVVCARLYATALGAYESYLNGVRVGDAILAPEASTADDHIFYQTYDVTKILRQGNNAFGAVVGDGWIAGAFAWRCERFGLHDGPRRFLAQLEIEYRDGSRETVTTDTSWRVAPSAIQSSEIYNGEIYDALHEQPGWAAADFDDSNWRKASVGTDLTLRLVAQLSPPIRRTMVLNPVSRCEPYPGVFVYDFGQNFSGWCRLSVKGKAGETVTLRYGEILLPDGCIDQSNLRFAAATDRYTLRGAANGEIYEPHFTYHGFRYVEVIGYPGAPDDDTISGIVVGSDVSVTGNFRADSPLVQRIWNNALWSQRANFFGVPTDCPQRDERMGWTGDIQVFLDAAAFNMDVDAFIRRFLHEMRAGQTPEGAYPVVTPQPRSFAPMWTAGWSEAGIILPWTLYRRYGDTQVIAENWQAMGRWMRFLAEANPDHLWRNRRGIDLGDWLSVDAVQPADETTPRILAATAYWAYAAALMAEMAAATGRADEASQYTELRAKIGAAFTAAFVRSDGTVGNGSQASYVLALHFGLVPESLCSAACAKLVADIVARGMKLSTGFLGTPYLLDVLLDNGQRDTAVSLLLQTGYPSWGYMIEKGATTMWERWNSDVGDIAMNSYNHYAFGAIVGTLYRRFAGIAPAAPGFRKILVDAVYDQRIGEVAASYLSCLGRIASRVSGDDAGISRLGLVIPANATARVVLPSQRNWREGGLSLNDRSDMQIIPGTRLTVEIGSGEYDFRAD